MPEWAPLSAKRFAKLVKSKFYDNTRFFGVKPDEVRCDSHSWKFNGLCWYFLPMVSVTKSNAISHAPNPTSIRTRFRWLQGTADMKGYAQFGIKKGKYQKKWDKRPLKDEPFGVMSNFEGTVAFWADPKEVRCSQQGAAK